MRHDCREPGRWWGSSPTNFATSTSPCSISLAKVVRRCTIGNDNGPNVLAILSTTTVNAFPLAILPGGSRQSPVPGSPGADQSPVPGSPGAPDPVTGSDTGGTA